MASRGVNSKCWEWEGHVHNSGYGRITHKGKTQYAHRFYWERINGPITEGLDVCHTCDNKLCVNPDHLFLGTRKDNMVDAMVKGRLQRGADRYNAVLNEEIVREARKRHQAGEKIVDIAKDLSIGKTTLGNAIKRKTWRHVA